MEKKSPSLPITAGVVLSGSAAACLGLSARAASDLLLSSSDERERSEREREITGREKEREGERGRERGRERTRRRPSGRVSAWRSRLRASGTESGRLAATATCRVQHTCAAQRSAGPPGRGGRKSDAVRERHCSRSSRHDSDRCRSKAPAAAHTCAAKRRPSGEGGRVARAARGVHVSP